MTSFPKTTVKDREYGKFLEDALKNYAVNTTSAGDMFGNNMAAVSLGLIDGVSTQKVRGFVDDVDSSVLSDIIYQGGLYPFLDNAELINVVSDNAADTNTIVITGLLADYTEAIEEVTLAGITPVQTTNSFIRINFVKMKDSPNIGTITLISDVTTSVVSVIGLRANGDGLNSSFQTIFTIPANKVGLVVHSFGSITRRGGSSGVKEGVISIHSRKFNENVFHIGNSITARSDGNSFILIGDDYPTMLEEKTDIKTDFYSFSGNTRVSTNLTIVLIDKTIYGL